MGRSRFFLGFCLAADPRRQIQSYTHFSSKQVGPRKAPGRTSWKAQPKQCSSSGGEMARQRKIKPGYNDSAAIARLSFNARLLDICLWSHLDGNAMIEESAASIKGKVFPRDDISSAQVTELIQELVNAGRYFILTVDRKRYLFRKDFRKEQRIYPDEPRIAQMDRGLLDSIDRDGTLPPEHAQSALVNLELFATSPSSSTSTSTSPSASRSASPGGNVDNSVPWSPSPTNWLENLKRTLRGHGPANGEAKA